MLNHKYRIFDGNPSCRKRTNGGTMHGMFAFLFIFEILNQQNEKINALANARFYPLKDNVGRSAIRNYLSEEAAYNWLLFLDSDVLPASPLFIDNYLKEASKKTGAVFCGGIRYLASDENKKLLRYKYGIKFEEINVDKRKKRPYKFFFTANFLIDKDIEVSDLKTLLKGLKLVSDYLDKTILKPNNLNYPNSRLLFINSFK